MAKCRNRPRVTVNCVADSYSGPGERIIEFIDPETGLGGLISFMRTADGLRVDVYRTDAGVIVNGPAVASGKVVADV